METKTYIVMEYYELENIVNNEFPNANFESVAQFEWNNDSSYDVDNVQNKVVPFFVTPEGQEIYLYGKDRTEKIEKYLSTGNYKLYDFSLYDLLMFLCIKGLIPEGNYLITVSW